MQIRSMVEHRILNVLPKAVYPSERCAICLCAHHSVQAPKQSS